MIRKYQYAIINEFIELKGQDLISIPETLHDRLEQIIRKAEDAKGNDKFELISHSIVRIDEALLLSVLIRKPMKEKS
jgi:hypothetical protein